MEFALVNGCRSAPSPKLTGECQVCGRPVVSKCGKQLIWHWAHKMKFSCDPWWENEGPWHRAWKKLFPEEFHEIVARDAFGEKHIADLKLSDGLVVELQHSAMSMEEMHSRETFYDRMIWIVDASPFKANITILGPLPNPSLPFVDDLIIVAPNPSWRTNQVVRERNYKSLMFARRSKQIHGDSVLMFEGGDIIKEDFDNTYVGHHLFLWMKPREVWYKTTRPVFLDFGDGSVGKLMRYRKDQNLWCVKLGKTANLIEHLLSRSLRPV